jgi:hypothetical protein
MPRYNTVNKTLSTTTNTNLGTPAAGLFTKFTGTAPYTVTLGNPVLYTGQIQTFFNATSGTVTVSTPNGVITGPGGGGAATFAVPAGTILQLISDGINYILGFNTGGVLTATSATFTSTISGSPANANVTFSPTGTGTVTISPAGALTVNPTTASSINNCSIGASTRGSGAFTTLDANSTVGLSGTNAAVTISPSGTGTVTISPGNTLTMNPGGALSMSPGGSLTINPTGASTINNCSIGASTRGSGAFTTLAANNAVTLTLGTDASSTSAGGTLTVTGGTAISARLYVGGLATFSGGVTGVVNYAMATGGTTLADQDGYYLAIATSSFTLNLPATSTNGRVIVVADGGNMSSFPITVGRNTRNIAGLAEDMILNLAGSKAEFVYYNGDWKMFAL